MITTIPGRWAKMISACGGVGKCAKRLGCSPTDLYRWGHGLHVPVPAMRAKIVRLAAKLEIASPVKVAT